MARDSHKAKSPSTKVGMVCWGLIFKNSGFKCSPACKFNNFLLSSMPRALAVIKTERQGAEPGK
ncbi:hypothetical protein CVS40_0215 [Lucilia cuprina]|nr:hypothetical protein CVS40_0215 [Lucilia cuprina]